MGDNEGEAATRDGARLLIVDDSETIRSGLRKMLEGAAGIGELLEAANGREAVEIARRERPTAVLMDIRMPEMDGIEATELLRAACPGVPVIVFSDSLDPTDVRRALEAGVSSYTVKADPEELRRAVAATVEGEGVLASRIVRPVIAHYVELLEASRERHRAVIESLAAAVEAKDVVTSKHLHRVQRIAVAVAGRIDPALAASEGFVFGCLLHDVGKIGVPEAILCKPGPLDEAEWEVMRTHPETGVRVVSPLDLEPTTIEIIRHHHERWDGSGYPAGLGGEGIPLAARIFSVCDALDAMISARPYRPAVPLEQALERIRAQAGSQFDPAVAKALVALISSGGLVVGSGRRPGEHDLLQESPPGD